MNKNSEARSTWAVLKKTLQEWSDDKAPRLAASLAYYTLFSLAPLLVFAVAVAGVIYGRQAAEGHLISQIQSFTGNQQTALFIDSLLRNAATPKGSLLATIIGLFGLLFGATGALGELKTSLNEIWDAEPPQTGGLRGWLVNRGVVLLMVLGCGLLLLLSLISTTVLAATTHWLDQRWPGLGLVSQIANFILFLLLTLLVFALIYRYLPDVEITWNDVWIGAAATAVLFSIGRYLISLYLGYSSVQSAYGAAGSLVVLLLWLYYSAQIFFLGAEFTQVYARTHGSRQEEHTLLETGDADKKGETTPASPAPATPRPARKHKSLSDLATAIGILAAVSLFSLVRRPFRS